MRSNTTPEEKDPTVVVSSIGENGSVEEARGLLLYQAQQEPVTTGFRHRCEPMASYPSRACVDPTKFGMRI